MKLRGQPSGTVVKFACSASAAGSSDLRSRPTHCLSSHAVAGVPHIKQMLAQGQSSSAKRGGLAADVSLGVNLPQKKKKIKLNITLKYSLFRLLIQQKLIVTFVCWALPQALDIWQ